jgi:ketol-acid reductoisomerase
MSASLNIAVLGYGSQGRAWTLNLRDAGQGIVVGVPSGHASRRLAAKDGIKNITTIGQAVKKSSVVVFAFPDHLHGQVYNRVIKRHLRKNSALIFLHGLSVHFGTVIPPRDCDVILLAPLGPGTAVREKFLKGEAIGYFYCIHQNATGKARAVLNQLANALRIDKNSMVKTSFEDEAIGDLFGEQAVLCGGLTQLLKTGFDTLVESGLAADKAYLEVAYQLDLIIDLIKRYGISGMYKRISVTARFGSYISGARIINRTVKQRMKLVLAEIKNGRFAEKLNNMSPAKIRRLNRRLKNMTTPSFEKSAGKFRPE